MVVLAVAILMTWACGPHNTVTLQHALLAVMTSCTPDPHWTLAQVIVFVAGWLCWPWQYSWALSLWTTTLWKCNITLTACVLGSMTSCTPDSHWTLAQVIVFVAGWLCWPWQYSWALSLWTTTLWKCNITLTACVLGSMTSCTPDPHWALAQVIVFLAGWLCWPWQCSWALSLWTATLWKCNITLRACVLGSGDIMHTRPSMGHDSDADRSSTIIE